MKIRYSLVLLCLLFAGVSQAQPVPNGSFEEWDMQGNPVGWITTNSPDAVSPVVKSTMHVAGQFSVEGRVLDFLGFPYPPFLATASESGEGFPLNARPEALNGFIAGQFSGGDAVQITVGVGNGGEDIFGVATHMLSTTTAGLTAFSAPIYYTKEGNADSAIISIQIVSSSQVSTGSVFFIDDLSFGDLATGNVKGEGEPTDFTVTYSDKYNEIAFAASSPAFSSLEILDMHGRTVETLYSGVTDQTRIRWAGQGFANGMYFARLTRPEGIEVRKLVLNR